MDAPQPRVVYEFDSFRVDADQRLLRSASDGQLIPLTARVFDTLLFFVEHRGELLDKARLMKAIWPNVIVEDNNLNQIISSLRKALGEGPAEHRFIVTVPGRGYRFVASVRKLEPAEIRTEPSTVASDERTAPPVDRTAPEPTAAASAP